VTPRPAELIAIVVLATVLTAALALPVLRAPSDRLFGAETVGRHHDPFTAMERFAGWHPEGVYAQPLTDTPGAWLARRLGPVAAFNVLVLVSFPLSALAAYLLARHLTVTPAGATMAALAYAFSPFHLAQAAYHPHIAQTQWVPIYLLALWRCLDRATAPRAAVLAAATVAVVLSNFYGGFIMAVVTPVAVGAYWAVRCRPGADARQHLTRTIVALLAVSVAGVAYVAGVAPAVLAAPQQFAFPATDLRLYSANWWSYVVPPVAHPLLGAAVSDFWTASGVDVGLLEQQIGLGWGLVVLAVLAALAWWQGHRQPSLWAVPVLAAIGLVAFACSLSPDYTIWGVHIIGLPAALHHVVPMFRAYGRFAVVVQLMAVLLAGLAVDHLWRMGRATPRAVCLGLIALTGGEYAASPATLSRDVLPTTAHRWVVEQAGSMQALDCAPLDMASAAVSWLTHARVAMGDASSDCTEPHLSDRLAGAGFTNLIVRRHTKDGSRLLSGSGTEGLRLVYDGPDAVVFAVPATRPAVYVGAMTGFFGREHDASWSWRWMGAAASWRLVNTGEAPTVAALDLEIVAFDRARALLIALDERPVQTLAVLPRRSVYRIGPLTLTPGDHHLTFQAVDAPTAPADLSGRGDVRRLSVAMGTWQWLPWGDQP